MGIFAGVRHRWIAKHTCVSPGNTRRRLIMIPIKASVRALGETDLNPVSGLGKISQLVFAVVQPSNVVANLIAGGVSFTLTVPFHQSTDALLKGWQKLVHNSELMN